VNTQLGPWSIDDLRHLAAHGTPVHERDHHWIAGDADPAAIEHAWVASAALGNRAAFDTLMTRRGVSVSEQVARWCRTRLRDDAPLPVWVEQLVASLQAAGLLGPDADCPLPAAMRAVANAECAAITPTLAAHGLAETAVSACGELLQQRLATLVQPVLRADARRVVEQQTGFGLFPRPPALRATLLRYPVLAECMVRTIRCWSAALHEFAERWQRDCWQLADRFNGGQALGSIVALRAEAADLHDGGRQVLLVTTESGLRLVYKPRSLAVDVAFDALLDWLRAQEPTCTLRVARPLDRGDYGWCAFIDHQPLGDAPESDDAAQASLVHDYYRQCGYLLALGYAINATDLHYENLIVHAGAPVPIDLETVIAPSFDPPVEALQQAGGLHVDRATVWQFLLNNVMSTCLLPHWLTVGGQWVEIGGFSGAVGESEAAIPPHRLTAVPSGQELGRHADALLSGFAHCYQVLLARAPRLLADDAGPLAGFRSVPLRFLHRDTAIYGALIRGSLAPEHLVDASRRDVYLERVYRAAFDNEHVMVGLMEAEREALLALDIPRFGIAADGLSIHDTVGERATLATWKTAVAQIRARLTALSAEDLERQLQLIRLSVLACVRTTGVDADAVAIDQAAAYQPDSDRADVLPVVAARARAVFDTGIADGDVRFWSSLRELPRTGAYAVEPIAIGLGNGALGFAQLLARLARAEPAGGWSARLSSTCQPLLEALTENRLPAAFRKRQLNVGLVDGAGGLVAGLAGLAEQCSDDADVAARCLQAAGVQAALHLDQDALRDDDRVDLCEGRAGAILGLLALRQAVLSAADAVVPTVDGVRRDADWCLDQALAHARCLAEHLPTAGLSARFAQSADTLQQARAGNWGPVFRGPAGVLLAVLHLHAALGDRTHLLIDLAEQLAADMPRLSQLDDRLKRPPTIAELLIRNRAEQHGLIAADACSDAQFARWLSERVHHAQREDTFARGRAGALACLQVMQAGAASSAVIATQLPLLQRRMVAVSARSAGQDTRCISLFHGDTGVLLCLLGEAHSGAMQWFFPPDTPSK